MHIPAQYREHTAIMADYYDAISPKAKSNIDTSFEEAFDAIYNETENLQYGEAKAYLSGLDDSQLEILRRYHTVSDDVDMLAINEEQAYNLLVHRNEQLDLDGDHIVETAKGNLFVTLPQEMPNELKRGIVDTIKQMQDEGLDYFKDISPVLMQLGFKYHLPAMMEHLRESQPEIWGNASVPTPDYGYSGLVEMQQSMHNRRPWALPRRRMEMFDRFMETLNAVLISDESGRKVMDGSPSESQESGNPDGEKPASLFDKVRAAGGALAYIQKLNLEKIEKLIGEKKKELEEQLNVAALEGTALKEALQAIEGMLEDYKKDLMEEMKRRSGPIHFDKDEFLKQLILSPEGMAENEAQALEAKEVG